MKTLLTDFNYRVAYTLALQGVWVKSSGLRITMRCGTWWGASNWSDPPFILGPNTPRVMATWPRRRWRVSGVHNANETSLR